MRTLAILLLTCTIACAETVDVKYRGVVDLKPFACKDAKSSFIDRTCYDAKNRYMLIQLKGTWYHYCEMPEAVYAQFIVADSMGRFFNQSIKGSGKDGPFDCRTKRAPTY
jgi:hypothetical protein